MIPEDARAYPGKDILSTWQRLQEWAAGLELSEGSRAVRIDKSRDGAVVTVSRLVEVVWPFEVSLSGGVGGSLAVEPGLMAGLPPWFRQKDGSRVRIDGLREDEDFGPLPRLTVERPGGIAEPDETFVAVRVRVERATGAIREDDPDALTVVYLTERPPRTADGGVVAAGDATDLPAVAWAAAVGYDILAVLTWFPDAAGVRRVTQAVHGNRKFSFKRGQDDRPDRFFFQLA